MSGAFTRQVERLLRVPARALYRLALASRPYEPVSVTTSAVVFSPHPDDETLGCGATIALKRRAGARVTVVEMTDGAASHPILIEPVALREVRAAEARAAAAVLGVAAEDVVLLGYPDGALATCADDAIERVAAALETLRPREVFVPYRDDGHADHVATCAIVRAALARCAFPPPVVYEYPVWFLHHWPLVDESAHGRVPVLSTLLWGVRGARRLRREFGSATDARDVLALKRRALECHRSQMTRPAGDSSWFSLADISGGDFLGLFLGAREVFRKTTASST
jgi:LmbE family N-acetylglucosaminyl deacetylase